MMILKEKRVCSFAKLDQAQQYLRAGGWVDFHAGSYRNKSKQGVARDIRKPLGKGFVIVETVYASV